MTRGVPVLDPERDLKGATPEKLALALLRQRETSLSPPTVRASVTGDEVTVEKSAADEMGDSVSHLDDGV